MNKAGENPVQEISIRPGSENDIPSLLKIEASSFTDARWKAEDFLQYECTVAEYGGKLAGYLVCRDLGPLTESGQHEREILNIAVHPALRRRGIASALLRHEIKSNTILFLEVRESNLAARNLYSTHKFREIGRRVAYYRDPIETAIVMQMK